MFHKIENRLVLLIIFILLSFTAVVLYLKAKEADILKSISDENNITLQSSILNYLTVELINPASKQKSNKWLRDRNYNLPRENKIILPESLIENFDDSLTKIISDATGSNVKIINKEEQKRYIQYLKDKPFISNVFISLSNTNNEISKILYAQKESVVLKNKYNSLNKENLKIILLLLMISLLITTGLYIQVVRPISTIISSFILKKPEQLKKLQNTKSEFGVVANLIKEFFDQRKVLEEEVKVRKITQEELETLNDELEKRVTDRTEELAITNIELQKERDQTKKYLDIAGTIIALLDQDGYIEIINKKGDEVLGYQAGELNGKNWYETCFHEKDRVKLKKMDSDIMLGKMQPNEFIISDVITKGRETRTLIFHKTFLRNNDNDYSGLLFSAEDITDLKLKEKELIEAKEKADESNRLKSTFLANMSHELRTPMIGILGYSDLLIAEIQNENHKKMAVAIHDSGQRLIDTLNLILDLSRLEANKHNIQIQVVNLNALVKNVTFHFEAAAGRKKLFIKTSVPTYDILAKTDPRMIRDVMNNLINNAIKFTNTGGVFITLVALHREFIITIKDTGIGIPKESIELIFEEFRQVSEGLGRGFQGTGLGLTICKKYVELLGGQIFVKSKPNEGSEFIIQIPLISEVSLDQEPTNGEDKKKLSELSNPIKTLSEQKKTDYKILVVEDDATSREVINQFLYDQYKVSFAENGEKALAYINENKYDLILLDINLGRGMTGIEVKEKIRTINGYDKTPIIAATAYAMAGDKEKFLRGGFDQYISKPYLKQDLLKLFADLLK